jgi:hypothetical protein
MLTHMHGGDVHLVVLACLQRGWSLQGRDGFGSLSPKEIEVSIFYCAEGKFVGEKEAFPTKCFHCFKRRTLCRMLGGRASDVGSLVRPVVSEQLSQSWHRTHPRTDHQTRDVSVRS